MPVNFHVGGILSYCYIYILGLLLLLNCCACDYFTAQRLKDYNYSSGKCLILPPLLLIILIIVLTYELAIV